MGIATAKAHASASEFTDRRDRVGVTLTVLASARLRGVRAICAVFFTLMLSTVGPAPAAAPKRPGQPDIRIASLEHRVHELINRERLDHQLPALAIDERLSTIARGHSHDMAARNFFSHTNPEGQDATARGKVAGFTCRKQVSSHSFREGLGENLFQDNLYSRVRISGTERAYDWHTAEELAEHSRKGWMSSMGHRHNILEPAYTQTGIGIAIGADDKVYFTQLFC
jgi:uncharacterized protein YkwD